MNTKAICWRIVAGTVVCLLSLALSQTVPAADITDQIELIKGRLRYDRRAKISYLDIALRNIGSDTCETPIRVVIAGTTEPSVTVANPDGQTDEGLPYFEYSTANGLLENGATTDNKRWSFNNPNRRRFNFTLETIEDSRIGSNISPTADAGEDQTHTLAQGQDEITITLDGSGSADSDGSIAVYTWTGTPDPTDEAMPTLSLGAGTYTFTLVVTDDAGATSDPDTVTVTIEAAANEPPVAHAGTDQTLTLPYGATTATVVLDGGASSDPDGQVVGYAWSGSPDPENVAQPTLVLEAGSYSFSLVVTDDAGAQSAPDTVTITVVAVDTGGPPTVTLDPAVYTVSEGEQLTFTVTAADPDGDPLTLSAAPLLENATFSAVAGAAAQGDFVFSPDYDQQGRHVVVFKARDPWGYTATATATIQVTNVNRPPVLGQPADVTLAEGELLSLVFEAEDPDGDNVALTADQLPDNALFIEATGTLVFTPDYTQSGEYEVTCQASDGALTDSRTVQIHVADVSDGGGGDGLELSVDPVQSPTLATTTRISGTVNSGGASPVQATTALITGLQPSTARQGETLDVVLSGQAVGDFVTHFAAGTSSADFGADITVNSLVVNGPSEAVANISIAPEAATGPRGIAVVSDAETAVSLLAFTVITGQVTVSGVFSDPESGAPVAGAIVTIAGTDITTTTDADGTFSFNDLPAGNYDIVINAPDHELIQLAVDAPAGDSVNLGTIESSPTVFDANAPPGATLASIHSRGLTRLLFDGDLEEARQLILDTIVTVGGNSYGMVDAYGNQLNPNVVGDGIASLRDAAADDMAERWQQGYTVPLGNMLTSFIDIARWESGRPPSPFTLLAAIQSVVDDAWQDLTNPDNALTIAMFAAGSSLVPGAPPTVSMDTPLNPLQSYLISSTLLGYISQEIEADTQGALNLRDTLLDALARLGALLGPAEAMAYDGSDPSLVTWENVFGVIQDTVYEVSAPLASGFVEDNLGVIMPSMTFNGFAKTTAVTMWSDFLNTLPQGSHVSSVASRLVENPKDMFTAFKETRKLAEDLARVAEHTQTAANIVQGALTGVVGNLSNFLLEKVLMGSIINNLIETSRPSAPYVERAVTVPPETGGLPSVHLIFRPCYDEVNTAAAGNDFRYFYAIYRKSTGKQLELITVLPSYRFYEPLADKDETEGRRDFKEQLKMEGRNIELVFADTDAPAGTNVYKIVTRVMRGRTLVTPPEADWGARMALDFLVSKASPGASATFNIFMSTMDAMFSIMQGTIYQVSDFSEAARVYVGTPVENLFPRLDLTTAEISGEVFVSIPDTNTILKWTPSGMKLKAVAGFAAPYQIGLACDVWGNLYSDNHASDMLYGGRIFRFSALDGSRALVGTVNYYSQMLHYANSADVRAMTYGIENGTQYLYVADGMVPRITRLDLRDGQTITSLNDRNVCHGDIRGTPEVPFNFQSNSRLYYDDAIATLYLTQGPELLQIKGGQVQKAFEGSFDPFADAWLTGVHGNRPDHVVIADMLTGDITMVPTVFLGSAGFGWDADDFRKLHRVATGLDAPQDLKVKPLSREFYVLDARGVHHRHFGVSGRIWDEDNGAPLGGATLLIDGIVAGKSDSEGYFTVNDVAETGPIALTIQAADGRTETLADAKKIYVEEVGPTILSDDVIFDPPPVPAPTDYDVSDLTAGDLVIDAATNPVTTPVAVTAETIGTAVTRHFILPAARVVTSDALATDLGLPTPPSADLQPAAAAQLSAADMPQLAPRAGTPTGGRSKKTFPIAVRLTSHPGLLKMAARSDGTAYEARRAVRGTVMVPQDYPEAAPSRVTVRINGSERQVDVVDGQFELPLDDMAAMATGMNTISVTAAASQVDRADGFLPPATRSALAPVGVYGQAVSDAPQPASEQTGDGAEAAAAYSWTAKADPGAARAMEGIAFTGLVAARAEAAERPLAMPGMSVIVYPADAGVTTPAQAREAALAIGTTDRAGYYEVVVPVSALEAASGQEADPFDPASLPEQELEVMVTPPSKIQGGTIALNPTATGEPIPEDQEILALPPVPTDGGIVTIN